MKITDIKCYVLEEPHPLPHFRWRAGLPGSGDGTPLDQLVRTAVLRMDTDAGITGWWHEGRRGDMVADLVRRRLKSLIGSNPLLTEQLWQRVWEIDRVEEIHMGLLGIVDLMAWDIKSKRAGMPVYQMLGGIDPKIPAYASTVTWETMDEYERYIKLCRDEGFTAFKLHAWGDWRADAELSANLRRWVGPDADLMFDGSAGWDLVTAIEFGRVLQDQGFLWYEEPMREFDLVSYAKLCEKLHIPILAAETSDGCHWNAATWIEMRALDMMRTSTHYKGGLTGGVKVAHLAESFGMRAEVHGGGYGNGHLCAAIPNNSYYEQLVMDEAQILGLKSQEHLPIVDGAVTIPDTPGLGYEPDAAWLEANAVAIV
ncbi:enolase C-terminal domain-like protein [Bauldia sp.]|uniref:enolase C-terminal domain-like protein n=1 Tax=Bauldia sp. TaxID=2575872 RepID=UPI003BA9FE85